MTKYLIFDTGALINFTSNGVLDLLRKLKEEFNGEFIITRSVKHEAIDHPLKIKRFEWGALRIKQLIDEGTIKMAENHVIRAEELENKMKQVLDKANNTFFANRNSIHIIDDGEAECMALSLLLTEQKIDNLVVIDERTARLLCEKPENIKKILKKKLHTGISSKLENVKEFNRIGVIRSTELAYIAYKRGYTKIKAPETLDALLFALKFGGVSISEDEIKEMKKIAKEK